MNLEMHIDLYIYEYGSTRERRTNSLENSLEVSTREARECRDKYRSVVNTG